MLTLQYLLRLPDSQQLVTDQKFGKRFSVGRDPFRGAELLGELISSSP